MLGGGRGGLTGPSTPVLPRAAPGTEGRGQPGRCPRSLTRVSGAGAGALCVGTGLHAAGDTQGFGVGVTMLPQSRALAMAGCGLGSCGERPWPDAGEAMGDPGELVPSAMSLVSRDLVRLWRESRNKVARPGSASGHQPVLIRSGRAILVAQHSLPLTSCALLILW